MLTFLCRGAVAASSVEAYTSRLVLAQRMSVLWGFLPGTTDGLDGRLGLDLFNLAEQEEVTTDAEGKVDG